MEFKKFKVKDIAIQVTDYVANGSFKSLKENVHTYSEPNYSLLIRLVDFNNDFNGPFKYIDKDSHNYLNKTQLSGDEIIISNVGANAGTVFKVPRLNKKMNLGPNSILVKFKGDNDYFYYYFKSPEGQYLIKSILSGSAQPKFNKTDFKNLIISVPELNVQKRIGFILSDIDRKIETNRKLIANLEELSQVLFKRWFVDFEFPDENGNPYKSNGGKFKESAIGDIPSDWEASVFNNFIEENIAGDWGKATSQKNYNSKVTIIRGADIPQLKKGEPGAPPSRYILEKNKDKKQIQNGDIVIEVSGGSPTQSTGRTLYVNQNILDRFRTPVLSTNFCRILRPKSIEYGQWLELYFQYLYEKDVFFNFENGTTGIKNFDYKAILTKFNIISPTNDIIRKFHYEISYLRDHIQNLGSENQKLSELRDTLLPKLMSGEIELPDNLEVTEDAELLQRR